MALGRGLNSLIPQQRATSATESSRRLPDINDVQNQKPAEVQPSGKPLHVPVGLITPNPEQPRKMFTHEALEELINSIREHGILQPLVVSQRADGTYELIAGERRLRSSQMLGLPTVPVVVRDVVGDKEKLELALIENIQRSDLNAIEEASAYERLANEYGLSHEQVGQRVGKSRSAVTNTIRLLQLPELIQKALIDGKISMGKARALLSIEDRDQQVRMFGDMVGEHMTVRDVESAVAHRQVSGGKGLTRRDPNVLDQEDAIRKTLGTKVRITKRGDHGKIEIDFYSEEEYREIIRHLLNETAP
ncbi:MAG: ParB/RepB/Spo0J family partition protein [Patescibacteria group bacterium]